MSLLHFCLHIIYIFKKSVFFKRGHIVLHLSVGLSVGQSVGQSVDHAMSAQYLLTLPNLAQWMLLAWE